MKYKNGHITQSMSQIKHNIYQNPNDIFQENRITKHKIDKATWEKKRKRDRNITTPYLQNILQSGNNQNSTISVWGGGGDRNTNQWNRIKNQEVNPQKNDQIISAEEAKIKECFENLDSHMDKQWNWILA